MNYLELIKLLNKVVHEYALPGKFIVDYDDCGGTEDGTLDGADIFYVQNGVTDLASDKCLTLINLTYLGDFDCWVDMDAFPKEVKLMVINFLHQPVKTWFENTPVEYRNVISDYKKIIYGTNENDKEN